MILEYIAPKFLDELYASLKKIHSDNNYKVRFSRLDLENSLSHHLNFVRNWSEQVSFKDLRGEKKLENVYIELDLYLTPLRLQLDEAERLQTIPLDKVVNRSSKHLVILGQPGAGKTTSMKKICQLCLFKNKKVSYRFPVYIALRDLSRNSETLFEYILKIFGIVILNSNEREASHEFFEKVTSELLDSFEAIIIFDGFDELSHRLKTNVARDIRKLSLLLNASKICITSRTGDFDIDIENADVYEIKELSERQIAKFAKKWLGTKESIEFVAQLSESPFAGTTIRPLNLSHMCAIYERIGKIPEKPKTVYRKMVNLLLEEWDEQREIHRNSIYSNFEVDRKREFLGQLSFVLTTKYDRVRFDSSIIKWIYLNYLHENFALPKDEVKMVIRELEDHTGLFFQSSYNEYEFCHKSVQEFLCAEYIVSLPKIPTNQNLILKIPNELAIAVSISSNPTLFFSNLILDTIFRKKWFNTQNIATITSDDKVLINLVFNNFLEIFLNRLIVEKVDYTSSPLLGVTILYLFTIRECVDDEVVSASLSNLLSELIKSSSVRRAVRKTTRYYEVSDDSNNSRQLVLKEAAEEDDIEFPKFLNFKYGLLIFGE